MLTQGLPSVGGLFLVLVAFKFALYAQINQGCIPALFSITSVYVGILFYFCFKEAISTAKGIGIVLICACIILLAMDKKEAADVDEDDSLSVS